MVEGLNGDSDKVEGRIKEVEKTPSLYPSGAPSFFKSYCKPTTRVIRAVRSECSNNWQADTSRRLPSISVSTKWEDIKKSRSTPPSTSRAASMFL